MQYSFTGDGIIKEKSKRNCHDDDHDRRLQVCRLERLTQQAQAQLARTQRNAMRRELVSSQSSSSSVLEKRLRISTIDDPTTTMMKNPIKYLDTGKSSLSRDLTGTFPRLVMFLSNLSVLFRRLRGSACSKKRKKRRRVNRG